MKTTNLKRAAVAGAISGALSLAALGLGAGVANADDDNGTVPFVPGGTTGDWQSYLPFLGSLGDLGNLGNIGNGGDLGNLGNLGDLGNLGNGQWQDLLRQVGG